MDVVKFIEERNRMCKSFGNRCTGCPASNGSDDDLCCIVSVTSTLDAKEQIAIVEKWSKEHPRKTRQDVFLEQWPEASIDNNGVLSVCPAAISSLYRDGGGKCSYTSRKCADCLYEFWAQEV